MSLKNSHLKTLILLALCAVTALSTSLITGKYCISSIEGTISSFMKDIYNSERSYIEALPIYDDYGTPERERILRTHLFRDHYREAKRLGVPPVTSADGIKSLAEKKLLVSVEPGEKDLYYFYNVRKEHRFLTPVAAVSLKKVADTFNRLLEEKDLPPVKIAVSSVLRPEKYQKNLRLTNENAIIVSTHSYGMSFDIFYDDYYVVLPENGKYPGNTEKILSGMRRRLGFMMGDSLRRQFRTVLFQTLIQLQKEGDIYAIFEKRQRCYHVTALK